MRAFRKLEMQKSLLVFARPIFVDALLCKQNPDDILQIYEYKYKFVLVKSTLHKPDKRVT
jgi:hypothetical protein